jgi:hypothetical protein
MASCLVGDKNWGGFGAARKALVFVAVAVSAFFGGDLAFGKSLLGMGMGMAVGGFMLVSLAWGLVFKAGHFAAFGNLAIALFLVLAHFAKLQGARHGAGDLVGSRHREVVNFFIAQAVSGGGGEGEL